MRVPHEARRAPRPHRHGLGREGPRRHARRRGAERPHLPRLLLRHLPRRHLRRALPGQRRPPRPRRRHRPEPVRGGADPRSGQGLRGGAARLRRRLPGRQRLPADRQRRRRRQAGSRPPRVDPDDADPDLGRRPSAHLLPGAGRRPRSALPVGVLVRPQRGPRPGDEPGRRLDPPLHLRRLRLPQRRRHLLRQRRRGHQRHQLPRLPRRGRLNRLERGGDRARGGIPDLRRGPGLLRPLLQGLGAQVHPNAREDPRRRRRTDPRRRHDGRPGHALRLGPEPREAAGLRPPAHLEG